MKDYERLILNELLDTYERSSLYKGKNERNLFIDFKFTLKNLPEYYDQTSSIYEDIHEFMLKLEEKSFIRIVWKNNKINHVITKVVLVLENVEQVYHYIKRQQLCSLENNCATILSVYAKKNETLYQFCNWARMRMEEGLSVKRFFDLHNTTDLKDLLKGVDAVTSNSEDYYIRELSILIYHDSKKLEGMLARIEAVIKEFHPDKNRFTDVYDILEEFNISKNPVWVMIKGSGSLLFRDSVLNNQKACLDHCESSYEPEKTEKSGSRETKKSQIWLSDFHQGIGLNGNDLLNIDIVEDKAVKRVITVENLTSFHRIYSEDSMIIYLAGFHNKARRELLKRVYEVYGQASYYHWGDIDAGGFKIYFDLCSKTCIPFRMLWMDTDTLVKYKEYAKKLTAHDKKELSQMLEKNEYTGILAGQKAEFKRVIKTMLDLDIKLEQEIVLEKFF